MQKIREGCLQDGRGWRDVLRDGPREQRDVRQGSSLENGASRDSLPEETALRDGFRGQSDVLRKPHRHGRHPCRNRRRFPAVPFLRNRVRSPYSLRML